LAESPKALQNSSKKNEQFNKIEKRLCRFVKEKKFCDLFKSGANNSIDEKAKETQQGKPSVHRLEWKLIFEDGPN
jgi:hypothetical protein